MLEAGYETGAYVRFDDMNHKGRIPTPEVIEDILRRLERTAFRLNAGQSLDEATTPLMEGPAPHG
ncbi:hypothetical protein GCM10027053_51800 [Intrasporangium mesophilum]